MRKAVVTDKDDSGRADGRNGQMGSGTGVLYASLLLPRYLFFSVFEMYVMYKVMALAFFWLS